MDWYIEYVITFLFLYMTSQSEMLQYFLNIFKRRLTCCATVRCFCEMELASLGAAAVGRSAVTTFKLFYVVGAAFKHHPFNEVNGYSRAAPL